MAAEAFRLMVRNPYLPDDYFRMKIEPTANVRDLKTLLFKHYHEHPEVGDQRLISGGKMLEDGERMKDLFTHEVPHYPSNLDPTKASSSCKPPTNSLICPH
jgi:hypothetical protein